MNPTVERALWASTPALRCLAPLDAILAPALGLYWIKTLPASGGLVGAVLGVVCLWYGIKRALGRDGAVQARLVHSGVKVRHQTQMRKSGVQDRLRRLVCVTRAA